MERRIEFEPAYDKRPTYGIHGVTLRFLLIGDAGAVQFVVYTKWQLPHVTEEHKRRYYAPSGDDPHWMERPLPADLGYHARMPHYEGQSSMGACSILGGAECYYDGSRLNAEPVFKRLLAEGDAGVWDALEKYYKRTFGIVEEITQS